MLPIAVTNAAFWGAEFTVILTTLLISRVLFTLTELALLYFLMSEKRYGVLCMYSNFLNRFFLS